VRHKKYILETKCSSRRFKNLNFVGMILQSKEGVFIPHFCLSRGTFWEVSPFTLFFFFFRAREIQMNHSTEQPLRKLISLSQGFLCTVNVAVTYIWPTVLPSGRQKQRTTNNRKMKWIKSGVGRHVSSLKTTSYSPQAR